MKRILFILAFSGMPCYFVSAQTVLHNRGQVVTKSTNKIKPIVYIKGSMQAGTDVVSGNTSAIAIERSKVILIGDLINDVAKGATGGTVFTALSADDAGTLEFRGSAAQNITTSGTTQATIPSKLENYINFPHIEINNSKHVNMDARLAGKTQNIELTKGWLVLDSQLADPLKDGPTADAANQSLLAHLLVEGQVDYKSANWNTIVDPNERGFIDVRLKVVSEGDRKYKSIVGFGSPFKEIRNDYFMFNTILAPVPSVMDKPQLVSQGPVIDPLTVLNAGKGYVLGIDLRGKNASDYDNHVNYPQIKFDQRAHEGYYFNRHLFASDPTRSANQVLGTDVTADAYQNETLNTENVVISLSPGWNYLANPFTCPLNIDDLLGNDEARTNWGIHSDVIVAHPQMFNHVWVLDPNSTVESVIGKPNRSLYSHNYQVAKRTGGTYEGNYDDGDNVAGVTALAPLQFFMIRAYSTARTITIPKSQRVMGSTPFIRSTPVNTKARRDDFILEFKDKTTLTTDRVSFVMRPASEIATNANYKNIARLQSSSDEANNASRATDEKSTRATNSFDQSIASQIYTKDAKGEPLTVQFLPIETTNSFVLYNTPSSVVQDISIRGLRLNTMDEVQEMWLEDLVRPAYMKITPELVYETTSLPTDREDRFVVRFRSTTSVGEEAADAQKIYAYDSNGIIWVEGFTDTDMGNNLQLIDLNGRVLSTAKVDDLKMKLSNSHAPGVYIIKMTGSRSQTIKLLVH